MEDILRTAGWEEGKKGGGIVRAPGEALVRVARERSCDRR